MSPRGDVNVDFLGEGFNPHTGSQTKGVYMCPRKIPNFVVADAAHLPFRDGSFSVVFSSHTIEHVSNPLLMLGEMLRVSRKKVVVRCPHKLGSGAKLPHHVNFLDEEWFNNAAIHLGVRSSQFVTAFDHRVGFKIIQALPIALQRNLPWKALKRFERIDPNARTRTPFEIEAWMKKNPLKTGSSAVRFVVGGDGKSVSNQRFHSGSYASSSDVAVIENTQESSLLSFFNGFVREHLNEDVWFVFCRSDFLLLEDLHLRLHGKEVDAVYGPIGAHWGRPELLGRVGVGDGSFVGERLAKDALVQTLDDACLIVHSEVFRQGLSFDERFGRYLYAADFCMQAAQLGVDVLAMQTSCQLGQSLQKDTSSQRYLQSLNLFKNKWKRFLPVKTTTTAVL